jgi:two-component system sensor histidine kinase BaeS
VLLVLALASVPLVRTIVAPLERLTRAARALGEGDLSTRSGIRRGDEVGELARAFDEMAERLERLVRDLLELARLDRREFEVALGPVDLSVVAAEAARRHAPAARGFGVGLVVAPADAATAIGDQGRLLQVVSNLVENALRVTPAGGQVTVRAERGALHVSDTGPGIGAEDLPHAFERFYLFSKYGADRQVGSGLGLAVVKELVEAMGGTVSVSSAEGVGTTFSVRLRSA